MRKGSVSFRKKMVDFTTMMNEYLSIREVAEIFNVNPMTIRRKISSGQLKAFKIGKRIKISPKDLETFMKENSVKVIKK